MRRIAGLVIGLMLWAVGLNAQTPTCTAGPLSVIGPNGRPAGDTAVIVNPSVTCIGLRPAPVVRTDTLKQKDPADSIALLATRDTLKRLRDSLKPTPPPPPPVDTTKPVPPVDTTKPTGSTVLFASDWSGGELDGGKWAKSTGTQDLNDVVPAPAGFPAGMKNVLRVRMGTGQWDWERANSTWTVPTAVGESRAFRIYLMSTVDQSQGWSSTHPVESTSGGANYTEQGGYAWHIGSLTGGKLQIAFSPGLGYPLNHWTMPNASGVNLGTLSTGVAYRLEWKFTRQASGQYALDLRWYDASGKLVADRSTLSTVEHRTLASYGTLSMPLTTASMTGFRVGMNGGPSLSGLQYVYWGGFAVCTDWCGAY